MLLCVFFFFIIIIQITVEFHGSPSPMLISLRSGRCSWPNYRIDPRQLGMSFFIISLALFPTSFWVIAIFSYHLFEKKLSVCLISLINLWLSPASRRIAPYVVMSAQGVLSIMPRNHISAVIKILFFFKCYGIYIYYFFPNSLLFRNMYLYDNILIKFPISHLFFSHEYQWGSEQSIHVQSKCYFTSQSYYLLQHIPVLNMSWHWKYVYVCIL